MLNVRLVSFKLNSRSFSYEIRNKMKDILYFRQCEDTNKFDLTFTFNGEGIVDRQFNLKRSLNETIEDFSSRMKTNIEKVVSTKLKRKKKASDEIDFVCGIEIKQDNKPICITKTCKEVFFEGDTNISINICGKDYNALINPPWVLSLSLPASLMVGSYAYPYKFDVMFGSKLCSEFVWYKSDYSGGNWTEVGKGNRLLLTDEFLGCKIKVVCVPGDGSRTGPPVEAESSTVVKPAPGTCPFQLRHEHTKDSLPSGSFRVVSYNILAEAYAETVTAKTELFPYCPSYALNSDYRKQLYIKEILGYNADIACLQEVDVRIFKSDLSQILEDRYDGVMARKSGSTAEGVATFYDKKKFNLIESKEITFAEEIDTNPLFTDIYEAVKKNEILLENFKLRPTCLQVLILESSDGIVVVGNTHLFFYPTADHVRLIQGGMAVKYIQDIIFNLRHKGNKCCMLFCGDMNSTPDCGLYLLMTEKKASSSLPDWCSDPNEVVKDLELTQPLEMKSAYGTPKFTNYTVGFSGCLDYIYYESDVLKLIKTVPIPDEEVLKVHSALPSPLFPSDHVALVADFLWNTS